MNYQLNESKMYADVADGSAIIINSETGIYYGLNGFGTAIYECLQSGASVSDITTAAAALPGAPVDMDARIASFIDVLVSKEIIEASYPATAEVVLDAAVAAADSFEPECAEFADAQELLLADPIHEVREDEGWSPEASSLNDDMEDVARRESKMGM